MAAPKFNLNNPAVKRILQEMKEMQSNPSEDYMSLPLEDNIFEWQFAIRGPLDSEFEGGIYHGRIQLPPEYPFKPPSFMLLTPNGRFETQTKICLSISQFHPEHWQPSWSVRTALVALIAFMPTKGNGAIGSLEFTKEERKALALKSVESPPKYGTAERQKVIDEIHEEMLKRVQKLPAEAPKEAESEAASMGTDSDGSKNIEETVAHVAVLPEVQSSEDVQPMETAEERPSAVESREVRSSPPARPITRLQASDDQFLTLLAIGLFVALAALLFKKFYHYFSWISFN
ncbi:hypothetical protein GOP47_0019786 [Adiantum capillus-veneris]|uniref:UBC core domain-containing protein n=1 Tax=Adiantum capillus-veneris TaxID=13818 RepID=A0A9D4UBR2_ADICA|nr:hypothetical protein GOP47_0019786 [Adiantum capillus-veneris]